GPWGTAGLTYPAVNVSGLPFSKRLQRPWPVSMEVFEELRQLVRPLVPEDALLLPGTEFGRLVGKIRGELPDFVWVTPWIPMTTAGVLAALNSSSPCCVTGEPADLSRDGQK